MNAPTRINSTCRIAYAWLLRMTTVTSSCSRAIVHNAEIVYSAAVDAQTHVTVVEKRMQGRDHPVLLGVPETYYLKCFILRKLA